jgi:tetratricopeptide (TPR) repeat protein
LNEPKNFQAIMLSSTFTDLKRHREQVIKAIREFGYKAEVMEDSGARADADVIDSSLKMVQDSVAYALIIGRKYGQTPICPERNPDRLSVTELEFNEAMRLKRPILLFIMDKKHPIIEEDIELDSDKRQKLEAFRERAKHMRDGEEVQRVYQTFENLEQFSTAAAIAIGRLVQHLDKQGVPKPIVAKIAVSNIPISVPLHFLGRDEDLAAIETALGRNEGRVAVTALHGLRGVGKTTVAAAYAERHGGQYHATWWIRAETVSAMRADIVGLGVRLGWVASDDKEEPALAAVMERLRNSEERLLLIFDNAVDAIALKPYLPRGATTRVLVTSNAHAWRGVAEPVEIRLWPKEIGADYLIARTGRKGERATAEALSAVLGGLPLAHEQAAAYCEDLGTSFAEYRRRFEAATIDFMDDKEHAPAEYHPEYVAEHRDHLTVAGTFSLAIDEAARRHPAAEPLIVHAALLAPEPIPLFLFSEARECFDESFASALGGDGLDKAVAALRAFALIDRETISDERDIAIVTDCIRVHRLVSQSAAVRRSDETQTELRRVLMEAVARVLPTELWATPAKWPRARRLDALALALVGSVAELKDSAQAAADILQELAAYRIIALAEYDQAQLLLERALHIVEAIYGTEHSDAVTIQSNLAYLFVCKGNFKDARALYERILATQEKALGSEAPAVAITLGNLASLLRNQGDVAGSLPFCERALAIQETSLGAEHPHTATSVNNLAGALELQGDLDRARPLYERALRIYEKTLGSEHPHTAASLNNLGGLLQAQGDFAGARPYLERALAIREKILGPAHLSTQDSARALAILSLAEVVAQRKGWLSRLRNWFSG